MSGTGSSILDVYSTRLVEKDEFIDAFSHGLEGCLVHRSDGYRVLAKPDGKDVIVIKFHGISLTLNVFEHLDRGKDNIKYLIKMNDQKAGFFFTRKEDSILNVDGSYVSYESLVDTHFNPELEKALKV